MEKWKLPCPGYGVFQELLWPNIKFDHMRDEETGKLDESKGEVLHVCEACGELSNEVTWKSGVGEWFAEAENDTIKSFHLSALYSPWKSWVDVVKNFLSSKDDTEMLKVWTNTELGEPWIEEGETVDFSELYQRREEYAAPVPKVMDRQSYKIETYKPPLVAPKRVLTADNLGVRLPGEPLYNGYHPNRRHVELLQNDLLELDEAITRREEWMCAQALFNAAIPVVGEGESRVIRFEFDNKLVSGSAVV